MIYDALPIDFLPSVEQWFRKSIYRSLFHPVQIFAFEQLAQLSVSDFSYGARFKESEFVKMAKLLAETGYTEQTSRLLFLVNKAIAAHEEHTDFRTAIQTVSIAHKMGWLTFRYDPLEAFDPQI
jgi:hypothetical protein